MDYVIPVTMRASVLLSAKTLVVEQRPVPVPRADEVLVHVTGVGVCGSDVHFFHDGRLGDWIVDAPLVLGHESGGVIVAVGANVTPTRVGERVSIEPQHPDPASPQSLAGHYNLDPAMAFYAVPGTDGAFAEYVTIQSHFAFAVPNGVSDDAAALMEPLSVAIAAVQKAKITVGSRVLITGCGPIGIVTAQVARAYGASEIIMTDISEERRAKALTFGVTRALDPLVESLAELGVDAFIDASGAASAVIGGLPAVRSGGIVVLVGMGSAEIPIPVPLIQARELVITGVFRYANTWPTAIELVRSGRVDLDSMVTGHFSLDQVEAAFASTGDATTLKSIVDPRL